MRFFDYFRSDRQSANVARDRLQVIVAHQRAHVGSPEWMPRLHKDLVEVIRRYVPIDADDVNVALDSEDGMDVLELNVNLPAMDA